MAVSDTLWQAEQDIRAYQDAGIITSYHDTAVEFVVAVMRAVRLMPGRDRVPDAPDTFETDLQDALRRYAARQPGPWAPVEDD